MPAERQPVVVGIDVGGTFTDIVVSRPTGVTIGKLSTTTGDPSAGMVAGMEQVLGDLAEAALIVHGTTIATNAVLERRGSRVGLLTTEGFRDVLEMRRRQRPSTYGMYGTFEPLVPRDLRLELPERVLASGEIERSPTGAEIEAAARRLIDAGAEALAVVLINSCVNPENEIEIGRVLASLDGVSHVSLSSAVSPEIKEFERTSTTVVNAYVQPVIDRYLAALERGAAEAGYEGDVAIVQSNGGIASAAATRTRPVTTILSGPAAGVTGAAHVGSAAGFRDLITFDMGGTSLDVSVIRDGAPTVTDEATIEFGVVVRAAMTEISTIAAGGGTIAHLDPAGFLTIGPESAGAVPGPVAYGRGGSEPTVTDANILLGRINPERPIGGLPRLDAESAARAVRDRIATPLGVSVERAAEAILQIATTKMAGAVRLATIERGHDPRDFALMAFGGAGPLHAGAVMKEVGIGRAVIPRHPGLLSALGCVVGDVQYDLASTVGLPLSADATPGLHAAWERLRDEGEQLLAEHGTLLDDSYALLGADMLYEGQTHSIIVELGRTMPAHEQILAAFEEAYRQTYGTTLPLGVRVLNARVRMVGERRAPDLAAPLDGLDERATPVSHRECMVEGRMRKVPVYDRAALGAGARVAGPAVVEQEDSTVFVDADLAGSVDGSGNLVLSA
jgi:N-methylhydantoinase A